MLRAKCEWQLQIAWGHLAKLMCSRSIFRTTDFWHLFWASEANYGSATPRWWWIKNHYNCQLTSLFFTCFRYTRNKKMFRIMSFKWFVLSWKCAVWINARWENALELNRHNTTYDGSFSVQAGTVWRLSHQKWKTRSQDGKTCSKKKLLTVFLNHTRLARKTGFQTMSI